MPLLFPLCAAAAAAPVRRPDPAHDARSADPLVEDLKAAGIDLDEGMVLKLGDRIYHGDECVHMLALLSTPVGLFNRLNAVLFRSRTASRIVYPILRTGRNAVLALTGRSKIGGNRVP